MARIANTTLFLKFTPGTTTNPTAAQVTSLITNYYKLLYEVAYGIGQYAAEDTDATDPQGVIRSAEIEGWLISEISETVQRWYEAGINSDGSINKMPSFKLSTEFEEKIKRAVAKKSDRIASIRVYGHDYDEREMI
jgi:hypothetical protein